MVKKEVKEPKQIEQPIQQAPSIETPQPPSKKNEDTLAVLTEKIDLLKNEVAENKLYLELCFIAILIILFGFFRTETGQSAVLNGTLLGKVMVAITVGIYIGIVYFFYSIIRFNQKNKKLIQEKIEELVRK